MESMLFCFTALHKPLGGSIKADVSVFENHLTIKRSVSGLIAMNTKLPSETTVYFNDLSGVNYIKPTGIVGMGWIELSGINATGNVMRTVDVNGKMFNNVDMANAVGNPYCIVFTKDKENMEIYYSKIKEAFQNYKNKANRNPVVTIQEESALDKIKKLQELLVIGAISQAEFDEKKAALLSNV